MKDVRFLEWLVGQEKWDKDKTDGGELEMEGCHGGDIVYGCSLSQSTTKGPPGGKLSYLNLTVKT